MTAGLPNARYRERGVALITALLVVAIAGVLAVELVWHTNLDLRRTEGLLNWGQAGEYGYLAESLGGYMVQQAIDGHGSDHLYTREDEENLCGNSLKFQVEAVSMVGRVCDAQGRFNLNNLVALDGRKDELVVRQFRRLLTAVDELGRQAMDDRPHTEIPADAIDTIVESTVDWIDPDSTAEGFRGAEDDYYTGQTPPYRAANWWFTDTSELLAVRGMTPEIYEALRPFITALPVGSGHTRINVNTASVPVFMSLGDEVSPDNALSWSSQKEPFTSTESFNGIVDQAMFPYIQYDSSYFQVQASIAVGTTRLDMYSLLEHEGQRMRVRLRSFGSIEADTTAGAAEAVTIKDGEVVKDDE